MPVDHCIIGTPDLMFTIGFIMVEPLKDEDHYWAVVFTYSDCQTLINLIDSLSDCVVCTLTIFDAFDALTLE
jgi:hypothetical protein